MPIALTTYNTVELTPSVTIRTSFKDEYIPALRSGFALYPINPRWNIQKVRAWKCGRQLRQSLDRGDRSTANPAAILAIQTEESCSAPLDSDPSRWWVLQPMPTV